MDGALSKPSWTGPLALVASACFLGSYAIMASACLPSLSFDLTVSVSLSCTHTHTHTHNHPLIHVVGRSTDPRVPLPVFLSNVNFSKSFKTPSNSR